MCDSDERWMRLALVEAEQALASGDVPVGALAVCDDVVIGRGHNRREADGDPCAHAEVIAIREAAGALRQVAPGGRVTLYAHCEAAACAMLIRAGW
ncbi:MAG: deaminase [Anaerolineaceae bacterium]|nr:deaminase [Anaerolineaceae bacterium]